MMRLMSIGCVVTNGPEGAVPMKRRPGILYRGGKGEQQADRLPCLESVRTLRPSAETGTVLFENGTWGEDIVETDLFSDTLSGANQTGPANQNSPMVTGRWHVVWSGLFPHARYVCGGSQ